MKPENNDATFFEAVVRSVISSLDTVPLRVDPRPVRDEAVGPDEELIMRAMTPGLADSAFQVVAARKGVLRKLGVADTADATRGKCPGLMTPVSPAQPNPALTLCPKNRLALAVVGVPRRISTDDTSEWVIRLSLTNFYPGAGAMTSIDDYVFMPSATGWRFVKKVNVILIE